MKNAGDAAADHHESVPEQNLSASQQNTDKYGQITEQQLHLEAEKSQTKIETQPLDLTCSNEEESAQLNKAQAFWQKHCLGNRLLWFTSVITCSVGMQLLGGSRFVAVMTGFFGILSADVLPQVQPAQQQIKRLRSSFLIRRCCAYFSTVTSFLLGVAIMLSAGLSCLTVGADCDLSNRRDPVFRQVVLGPWFFVQAAVAYSLARKSGYVVHILSFKASTDGDTPPRIIVDSQVADGKDSCVQHVQTAVVGDHW